MPWAPSGNIRGPAGPSFRGERVLATTATLTPDCLVEEQVTVTALAGPLTIAAPTNATSGDRLLFYLKDNGTSQSLIWNAAFASTAGAALPTTTTPGKTLIVGTRYHGTSAKHHCLAVTST